MSKKSPNSHTFGPGSSGSKGKGHPVMFGFSDAEMFGDFPAGGGYPLRFLAKAFDKLQVEDPTKVLHLCSGSMKVGITVDIRETTRPKIVADARCTPFPDKSFQWIMVDPPYSEEYANNLYGTSYPKPGQILKEVSRLLCPGGKCGFLHFQVPMFRKPLKLLEVVGISTGLGYNIRAFSIFQKLGDE